MEVIRRESSTRNSKSSKSSTLVTLPRQGEPCGYSNAKSQFAAICQRNKLVGRSTVATSNRTRMAKVTSRGKHSRNMCR